VDAEQTCDNKLASFSILQEITNFGLIYKNEISVLMLNTIMTY
jgi:hypothetical protein